MSREIINKNINELNHWLNGGDVYAYYEPDNWIKLYDDYDWTIDTYFVIKDKHFEARKAYALGEEIEYKCYNTDYKWEPCEDPWFVDETEYRPKQKVKTIVMEEWYYIRRDNMKWIGWFENETECHAYGTPVKKLSERTIEIEE